MQGSLFKKINPFTALSLLVIIFLFWYPYYLFGGRLFLGGDDTRFYFVYPSEFLKSLTIYSWNNISSLPYFIPNHQWLPLVATLSLFGKIFNSKVQLEYFSFSSLLILGFMFFQKFIRELIGNDEYSVSFIASIIYIFCPITLVGLMYSLAPVWLLTLVPIVGYYYASYLKRGNTSDLVKVVLWSILFSFVYFSIAWIVALLLPLVCATAFYSIFIENPISKFAKKTIIFGFFIVSSQLFWLVSFIASLTSGGSTSLFQEVASISIAETFKNFIDSTATDNIIYPLLTYYHRQIAVDFEWQLKGVFLSYYDHIILLSLIFIVTIFLGVLNYKQTLSSNLKKIFVFFFAAFIVILYFSTVNIGFLKYIFFYLGYLPGFAILRNFTDKFAFAFVFIYVTLLSMCLLVIKRKYKYYPVIFGATIIVTLINFLPAKQIIASPLWRTNSVYTTVNLPSEYISFTNDVKTKIPNDANILAFPQNNTAYSVIAEDNGTHAYVGTSPFKFLTGVNDLSGMDSYYPAISSQVKTLILKQDSKNLLKLLSTLNVGYVMTIGNIPNEVLRSYLFDSTYLKAQDKKFIQSLISQQLLRSNNGNYILYKLNNSQKIIAANVPITYKKISPVLYKIYIKHLKADTELQFHETYHPGWTLYIQEKPMFSNTHSELSPYGNKWIISPNLIKKDLSEKFYKKNPDGSIDVEVSLYFSPQNYFYIGTALTFALLIWGFILVNKNEKKKGNN